MIRGEGACLVCGMPLTYFETAQKMECVFCHQQFESYASCEDGHYVCDECHAANGGYQMKNLICILLELLGPEQEETDVMDASWEKVKEE